MSDAEVSLLTQPPHTWLIMDFLIWKEEMHKKIQDKTNCISVDMAIA